MISRQEHFGLHVALVIALISKQGKEIMKNERPREWLDTQIVTNWDQWDRNVDRVRQTPTGLHRTTQNGPTSEDRPDRR